MRALKSVIKSPKIAFHHYNAFVFRTATHKNL